MVGDRNLDLIFITVFAWEFALACGKQQISMFNCYRAAAISQVFALVCAEPRRIK